MAGLTSIMRVKYKTNLIWHFLFMDAFYLALRLGGLTVLDLMVHAGFLILATAALLAHQRTATVPKPYYYLVVPILLVALLQLVPLPPGLFQALAPLKSRVSHTAHELFPQVQFSTQLTMMPELHLLKLASLALDCYALALLLMAPRPSSNTLRGWLFLLAVVFGVLANMAGNDLIDSSSLISFYQGTLGALVNPNHFATYAILIMIPVLAQAIILIRRALKLYREVKPTPIDACARKLLGAVALLGAFLILLSGFRLAYSRSGMINLTIAIFVVCATLVATYRGRFRYALWAAPLAVPLIALLLLPFTGALQKFEDRGVQTGQRIQCLVSGREILQDMHYLGTGLGSTEGILNQRFPQPPYRTTTFREFHNDFLQNLVEFGPLGLLVVLGLVIWLMREAIVNLAERKFETRIMAAVALGLVLMLCADSSISFPLRVTSIRMLALILVAYSLKPDEFPCRDTRNQVWRFTPLVLGAVTVLASILPTALDAGNAESYPEERELRYGRFSEAALLSADRELSDIFNYNPPIEFTKERIPLIRAYVLEHLKDQIYSVQGLTLMLMLEIIEERIAHPNQFDPQAYARFHAMAKTIGDLGDNSNAHATAPWMFLFATYRPWLPEADRQAFDKIRADWHYHYYKRQVDLFPESKNDYVLPSTDADKPEPER